MARETMEKLSLDELIAIGDQWQKLGWAVQGQIRDVLRGEKNAVNCNSNALAKFVSFVNANKMHLDSYEYEDAVDLFDPEGT